MPHIAISMHPGRDTEIKREIAERMKQQYVEIFGVDDSAVSVSIIEIPAEHFAETIQQRYLPEDLYISSRVIPGTNNTAE